MHNWGVMVSNRSSNLTLSSLACIPAQVVMAKTMAKRPYGSLQQLEATVVPSVCHGDEPDRLDRVGDFDCLMRSFG